VSNIAVIYHSKYGSTERYARWIAEELGAPVFDARKFKKKDLALYDTIVYGGGIYAGGIKGIELITKNWYKGLDEKKVIVFAVGITVESQACRQQCLEVNFEKRFVTDAVEDQGKDSGQFTVSELLKEKMLPIRCFFLPGAFDPARIRGIDKAIMAVTRRMMDTGARGDSVEGAIARYMTEGCDLIDRAAIAPVVEAARGEDRPHSLTEGTDGGEVE
jgi:menaquinone-dependent protoporphyrinogen IX oxidase